MDISWFGYQVPNPSNGGQGSIQTKPVYRTTYVPNTYRMTVFLGSYRRPIMYMGWLTLELVNRSQWRNKPDAIWSFIQHDASRHDVVLHVNLNNPASSRRLNPHTMPWLSCHSMVHHSSIGPISMVHQSATDSQVCVVPRIDSSGIAIVYGNLLPGLMFRAILI